MWLYLNSSKPSPTAKLNHTAKASSCKECKKGICPKHQFGMILKPCQKEEFRKSTKVKSISSSAASHSCVKISVVQELEKAWQASEADYFMRSSGCAAKLSQDSYFWKTYLPLLPEEERKWSEKLPRWGMIVDGALYPLHPLEPCIKEKGGSCWPTPCHRDWRSAEQKNLRKNQSNTFVKMIATPTASKASNPIRKPCPSAAAGKHGEYTQESIGRLNPEMIGKKLSPMFVELLMGFPEGWTGLNPLEIPWCPNR